MTPTLSGRWQTRLLLMTVIGVPVTVFYAFLFSRLGANSIALWLFLIGITLFGFVWDVLYHTIQQRRWDHDWPPFMQWLAAIWEAIFIYIIHLLIVNILGLQSVNVLFFVIHYFTIFTLIFAANHSLMRVIFPRWRYKGGQVI